MALTRLWFIRHGEVEEKYVGTFVGHLDVGLSDVGRHQAAAVAAYLEDAPVDAILSSPSIRATETAAPLAKAKGQKVEPRAPFREMSFGDWEGLHWHEIERRDPAFAAKWQGDPAAHACPGGENVTDFSRRVQAAVESLVPEFAGRTVALFGHAGVNRAILAQITQRPYMESFVFAQDYGCVNAAGWDTETGFGQVAMVNMVPGPRSVQHGDGGRRIG